MAEDDPVEPAETGEEAEQTEEIVEHVAVAPTAEPPPAASVVAVVTPASGVQPSSFMTRWKGSQWLVAALALLGPLALMAGLIYVFRDALRRAFTAIGF